MQGEWMQGAGCRALDAGRMDARIVSALEIFDEVLQHMVLRLMKVLRIRSLELGQVVIHQNLQHVSISWYILVPQAEG